MLPSEELLQSIDILAQNAVKDSVKIYTATVLTVDNNGICSIRVNGKTHSNIAYYGDTPTVNNSYRVFCPNGSMNQAFIITGGGSSTYALPIASADTLGGIKVGAGLSISEQGTLSATGGGTADAVEWNNVLDKPNTIAGYGITDAKIDGNTVVLGNKTITPYTPSNPPEYPVASVNGKTGVVVLNAADVGALPSATVIPTKTSQLDNDSHYIKASEAPVQSVNTKTGAVQLNANDVGALPNTTVIPSKTSQLDNDSGFITELPIASTTQIGGIKIGAGLSVTENGTLSATGGGTADAVEWNNVLDKPTTIAGYGITDAVSKTGDTMTGNLTVGSASLQTNGYITGTWLKTTANTALSSVASKIAVINDGWIYSRTAEQIKSDIGLGSVDNVKQYSVTNPPPYPVTSVNGQTGAVTIDNKGIDFQLSPTQPTDQSTGDYWYHVTGTANI
mgnify:CR=1 FL=1